MALTRYGSMIVWSAVGFVIFLIVAVSKFGGNPYVMFSGIIIFVSVFLYGFRNWKEKESGMNPPMSDDLKQRAAAASTTHLFHSYATPKFWSIAGILLVGAYYLSSVIGDHRGGSEWTPFSVLTLIMVYGFIAYRWFKLRQVWPKFRRYAEHLGWTVDEQNNGRDLVPLHFAPPPRASKYPVTSELHVMRRDGSSLFLVVEEFVQTGGHMKTTVSVLCWLAVRLPGRVDGWLRLLPEEKMFFKILRDYDIEYHAFNQKYYVHAEPKKLGTQILSPDLIAWYFNLPIRPWLHVEGDVACLSVGWNPTYVQLQQLIEAGSQISEFIKHGGALEKPPPFSNQDKV